RVVLIDAGRNESNWAMGSLYNGFADSLKQDVRDRVQDPNLYVINATRQNDIAWTAPEMGATPFGYFIAEALNGGGSTGGRITLSEFVDYVTQHVDGFAANYRGGARQQPELITVGDTTKKIGLTYPAGVTIEPPAARAASEMQVRLAKLSELSLGAAAVQDRQFAYAYEPESFSRLQHLLMRLELLAVAGEAYDEQYNDAYLEAEALIAELPLARGRFASRQNFSPSLALAGELTPISQELYTDYAQRWKAWLDKPEAERTMDELPVADYPVAADVIWRWLIEPENGVVTRDRLALAVSALQAAAGDANRLEYSELHATRLLLRDVEWTRVGDEVGLTLRLLRDAETTAAMPDLRAHYWLRPRLAQLDRALHAAHDHLLVGSSQSLARCRQLCMGLAGQQQGYTVLRAQRDAWVAAIRLRDRAFALLPHYANWVANHPKLEQRSELLQQCVDALRVAHQLGSRLDQSPSDDWEQQWGEVESDFQLLDQKMASLTQFFHATCDRL
ncbi:MAG: hypothetical protein KDA51_16390, partial [Planctomycetales bacterium]|nr:hypothetical protein [Planctomycetales bacterium]